MVVRMRHTRAHTANRRSHHALAGERFGVCSKCKTLHLRHHACEACGFYRGKEVIAVASNKAKKARVEASVVKTEAKVKQAVIKKTK